MTNPEADQPTVRTPPEIADALRGMIREGRFRPGDRLGTAALAAEFGVSRGPVREALRLLESRNLVQVERHRGAFVVDIEDHEILETLTIREVLFGLLAERCAAEASEEAVDVIRTSVDDLAELHRDPAVTPQRFQRATFAVIHTMFDAIGRGRLSTMIADLTEGAGDTYGHLSMATRDMRAIELKAYQTLLRAVADRDPARAFAAARRMHDRGVSRARELQALTGRR